MAIDIDAIEARSKAAEGSEVKQEEVTTETTETTETAEVTEQVTETTAELTETKEAEVTETTETQAVKEVESTQEPEEVEIGSYVIDVDGQERTVDELLDERDELSKRVAEIEGDQFLKGLIDHYKANGNVDAYLEAKAVNYDKKNDLEIIRAQFEKENSDLDPETRELLFQEELQSKYKFNPNADPEDLDTNSSQYKLGQALLKRDADKVRSKFKEEQSKYQAPEKKAAPAVDPEKLRAEYKKQIASNEDMAKFLDKKLLKLEVKSEDGKQFGYEVENPESVIEMMTNDSLFFGQFQDKETGSINYAKAAKVYAYSQNPEAFEKQLVEFGKTLATEKILKEKRNADGVLEGKKSSGAAGGTGDWRDDFLKAARQQKKV